MLIPVLLAQLLMIDGLPGGELQWRESGDYQYEIAVSLHGETVSPWTVYPLSFNQAKLFCTYNCEDSTLEVNSQMPSTFEYTYAWYLVDSNWNLALFDQGESDYYGGIRRDVKSLLEDGYMEDAVSAAMDMMYPGALPYPEEFCAMFVIAAAREGTPEAFAIASDVSRYFLYCGIEDIQCDSEEFLNALELYYRITTERNLNDE